GERRSGMQRPGKPLSRLGPWTWVLVLAVVAACAAPAPPAAPASKPAAAAPQAPVQAAAAAPAVPAQSAPAPSPGKQLLDDLVKRAGEERELRIAIATGWDQEMIQRLGEAFKKRFNLTIDIHLAPVLGTQHLPVAIAETRSGVPPTYDAVYGDDT